VFVLKSRVRIRVACQVVPTHYQAPSSAFSLCSRVRVIRPSLVRLRVHYISPSPLPILFGEDKPCHAVFYVLLVFVFVLVLLVFVYVPSLSCCSIDSPAM
jgi:hypothetical protein